LLASPALGRQQPAMPATDCVNLQTTPFDKVVPPDEPG